MATEHPDFDEYIERLIMRLEFAMARKWLKENPLSPDQPTVGVMLSQPEKPRLTMRRPPRAAEPA
jgi:hypothetical protein